MTCNCGNVQLTPSLIDLLTLDGADTVRVSAPLQFSDPAVTVSLTVIPLGPTWVVFPAPDDQ